MMKRFILTISLVAVFGVTSRAQDEQEFRACMKTAAGACGNLKKNLDNKMGPEAAKDAEKVAAAFKQMEAMWAKTNTEDAVNWAKKAQTAANEVAAAAAAGKMDDAAASFKSLTSNCSACHAAHREKVEGGFKIKP